MMTENVCEMTDEEYDNDCKKSMKDFMDKITKQAKEEYEKLKNKDIVPFEFFYDIYMLGKDGLSFKLEDSHLISGDENNDKKSI